ncbi:hypothetical protein EYF80_040760 [Liparis tanakae]|uniref:Uncharacterized protein n=1 Tax=Liparis tanakae TaxID=230148 RepID=A0A4Z2G936_9TELE|nr:hypothetical protein EYF80_040760 [Liparis tanakae]
MDRPLSPTLLTTGVLVGHVAHVWTRAPLAELSDDPRRCKNAKGSFPGVCSLLQGHAHTGLRFTLCMFNPAAQRRGQIRPVEGSFSLAPHRLLMRGARRLLSPLSPARRIQSPSSPCCSLHSEQLVSLRRLDMQTDGCLCRAALRETLHMEWF